MKRLARWYYLVSRMRWWITRPVTLGVRLIPIRSETVLLVKHTYQRHWYLPGGGVKRGETLEEAVRREAAEEVGATLGPLRLFGVYTNFYEYKSDHVVVFACEEFTLASTTDREIERSAFFALDDLPLDTSPGSLRRLQEYREGGSGALVGHW